MSSDLKIEISKDFHIKCCMSPFYKFSNRTGQVKQEAHNIKKDQFGLMNHEPKTTLHYDS